MPISAIACFAVGMIGKFRESSSGRVTPRRCLDSARQLDRHTQRTCEAQPEAQAIAVFRSANGKCFTSPGVIHPNMAVI